MNNEKFEKFIQESAVVFDIKPQIFTTGAFLCPLKVTTHRGETLWVWYVTEFIDDSYDDDGKVFNPSENAPNRDDLLFDEYYDEE